MTTASNSISEISQRRFDAARGAETSAGVSQSEALLRLLEHDFGRKQTDDQEAVWQFLSCTMANTGAALRDRECELQSLSETSEQMAMAQADAIVHSAEIIDELERTRQSLSDARSAAEAAAQDTQRLADTIFERTNDGVIVFQDGLCIACNDNALKLLGSSRDDILHRWPRVFESARLEDGSSAAEQLRRFVSNVNHCQVTSMEVQLPTDSNTRFWAEMSVSSFDMKDAGHVLLLVRDVTARKQFEVELRRHHDFLDNIINAVPDQLVVSAKDGTVLVANDAFCAARGADRHEIVGSNWRDVSCAAYLAAGGDDDIEAVEAGGSHAESQAVIDADGSERMVSVRRSVFQDTATGQNYSIATSRDITDDHRREDRLRLLASVFESASEGVAILSSDGSIREANPAFLSMIGDAEHSPADDSGAPMALGAGLQLTDRLQIDADDVSAILKQVAAGTPWSGKGRLTGPAQGHRSYWISLSPSSETGQHTTQIIALVSDITELEQTQRKLRWQASYDNLTGLPNRRFFREHLEQLVAAARVSGDGVAIVFLDLDDFKHVNDSSGHAQGDLLLQAVAKRIKNIVGREAFAARFGGDEFAIILTGDQSERRQLDALIMTLLQEFRKPFDLPDTNAVIGLSIGVTHYPDHANDVESLMSNADIAMYAAKLSGKNRVLYYSPEMQANVDMRHQVQSRLRQALKEGELMLWYQPKVDAISGQSAGCEALVRWQTADGKFIPPNEFIPIAEQTGLIECLGGVVFEMAAIQASEWYRSGLEPSIAVNVSAHQIRHSRFVEQLTATLAKTGARADWFELEITEYAMMDDVELAAEVIHNLTSLGFRVAIDDFGTGYSSLSYLKSFPINTLKIDSSFVQDVTTSVESRAVVQSIISLGLGLNLTVVAEGVETASQASLLAESGCTILQGYYFGKPMPPLEYGEWFAANRPENSVASAHPN